MKKEIKNIFNSKFMKTMGIPLLLLFLWFGLTAHYIYTFDTALSVISFVHNKDSVVKDNNFKKLLKGQKISGEFEAEDDNLGILSVRFKTFIRPIFEREDLLVFRIKEKGANDWLAENEYMNGLMYDAQPFPFGFPVQEDSKGRRYYFEIESLKGNEGNAIALSDKGQVLFSKYQVNKQELLQNKKELVSFAIKKFYNSFFSNSVKFFSFVYLLPFVFYLMWISPIGSNIKKYIQRNERRNKKLEMTVYRAFRLIAPYYPFHAILYVIILIDIFVVSYNNDILYLVIIGIWIFVLKAYKQSSRPTFATALLLLIFSPVFLELNDYFTAEKFAIWSYMFMIAGAIQIFLELRKDKSKLKNNV